MALTRINWTLARKSTVAFARPPRSICLTWMDHKANRVLETYYAIGRGRRDIRNGQRNF
jgi:hypothetical protein